MEEKQIALKPAMANRLSQLIYEHGLPITLTVGPKLKYLKEITMSYHTCDELLVEWLIFRVTEDDNYAV